MWHDRWWVADNPSPAVAIDSQYDAVALGFALTVTPAAPCPAQVRALESRDRESRAVVADLTKQVDVLQAGNRDLHAKLRDPGTETRRTVQSMETQLVRLERRVGHLSESKRWVSCACG